MSTFECDECGSKAFSVHVLNLQNGRTLAKRLDCRTCGEENDIGAVASIND